MWVHIGDTCVHVALCRWRAWRICSRKIYAQHAPGFVPVALFAVVLLLVTACSEEYSYENACPRITHAEATGWEDDGLHVGIWIQDIEKDPVDLAVFTDDGTEIVDVAGHGSVGLTSSPDSKGTAHELVLSGEPVEKAKSVTFEPTDVAGCQGDSAAVAVAVYSR